MLTINAVSDEQRKMVETHYLEAIARHQQLLEILGKNERLLRALGNWVPPQPTLPRELWVRRRWVR